VCPVEFPVLLSFPPFGLFQLSRFVKLLVSFAYFHVHLELVFSLADSLAVEKASVVLIFGFYLVMRLYAVF
jgi:hypothetical protein